MFKNHITTISPLSVNSKPPLPSLTHFGLSQNGSEVLIPNKFGAVPIYQDKVKYVDFGRGIRDKTVNNTTNDTNDLNKDGKNESSQLKEYETSRFVEFGSYDLKNPAEKLFNVAVIGFGNLPDSLIEQILNLLINESDELESVSEFKWSYVDDVDNKVVFFKLLSDDLDSVKRLTKLNLFKDISVLRDKLVFSQNSGLLKYVTDVLGEDFKMEIDVDSVQEKIKNRIKFNNTAKESTSNTNSDYVVDESQLADNPADVLPQLKKDIKDFRLKVIEIEKRKREKEKHDEIRRSKAQLRKLFANTKKDDSSMDIDDDDEEEEEEEDDGLTDEQFEEARLEKEKVTMMRNYTIKSVSIKSIERHGKELIELEKQLMDYETNLDKTIKPGYEQGKFEPSGVNREVEAEKDEIDRLKAVKEAQEEQVSSISKEQNVKVPIKVSIKQTEEEEEEEEPEESKEKSDLDISEEKLANALVSIKEKIESYLEDLLEVADEELTEYITMTIQDTKSKSALTEELKETLDEDAEKISELIWKDLLQAIV